MVYIFIENLPYKCTIIYIIEYISLKIYKINRVILSGVIVDNCHWHCRMWLNERDVPMNHHQGHSGLFKTAGFADHQLEVKAID